jgi:hypothetical protein
MSRRAEEIPVTSFVLLRKGGQITRRRAVLAPYCVLAILPTQLLLVAAVRKAASGSLIKRADLLLVRRRSLERAQTHLVLCTVSRSSALSDLKPTVQSRPAHLGANALQSSTGA